MVKQVSVFIHMEIRKSAKTFEVFKTSKVSIIQVLFHLAPYNHAIRFLFFILTDYQQRFYRQISSRYFSIFPRLFPISSSGTRYQTLLRLSDLAKYVAGIQFLTAGKRYFQKCSKEA